MNDAQNQAHHNLKLVAVACRRISNRESARRLRKQRSEKLGELQSQQGSLQSRASNLDNQLAEAHLMLQQLLAENNVLRMELGDPVDPVRCSTTPDNGSIDVPRCSSVRLAARMEAEDEFHCCVPASTSSQLACLLGGSCLAQLCLHRCTVAVPHLATSKQWHPSVLRTDGRSATR